MQQSILAIPPYESNFSPHIWGLGMRLGGIDEMTIMNHPEGNKKEQYQNSIKNN